jgi:hypothetical protein
MKAFEIRNYKNVHRLVSEIAKLEIGPAWEYSGAEIPENVLPAGFAALEIEVARAYEEHKTMENIVEAENCEAIMAFVRFLLEPIWCEVPETLRGFGLEKVAGHNFIVRGLVQNY